MSDTNTSGSAPVKKNITRRDVLAMAGCGVAMGNAPERVKALADAVCPHVDEDGVAALCRTLFPEAFPNG